MKLCVITSTHERTGGHLRTTHHTSEGSPARSARAPRLAPRLAIAASPPPPPPCAQTGDEPKTGKRMVGVAKHEEPRTGAPGAQDEG